MIFLKGLSLLSYFLLFHFCLLKTQTIITQCRERIKSAFLFKTLVIDKTKLDASYYFKYDNIKWDGKIIVIGDLHGDIESLKLILKYSNLVDENENWIAENVLLIQVGDVLNKGIYGPYIYDLLFDLQKQSKKKNSKIMLLLGNHEQNNLCGNFRSVIDEEIKVVFHNNYENRIYNFSNINGYYYKRLIRLPSIIKVNNIIYTHGGINNKSSQFSVDLTNIKIRLQIENKCNVVKYDPYDYLNKESVLWYKTMAQKVQQNSVKVCKHLFKYLNRLNANYLVVGHTPQLCHKILSFCNNSYFLIDTKISSFLNDGQAFPNYLEIENGKFTSVHMNIKECEKKQKKKTCQCVIIKHNSQNKKMCIYEQREAF